MSMRTRGPIRPRRARRAVATTLVVALLAACSGSDSSAPATTTGATSTTVGSTVVDGPAGAPGRTLGIRLSEGEGETDETAATPIVDGAPLDEGTLGSILDRLTPFATGDESTPFSWPAQTLAPPRAGATVQAAFPITPEEPAPVVPTGAPVVTRYQPEGDVPIAPFVSITFDQPMVAVGTVAQTNPTDLPVTIETTTPGATAPTGEWSWVGTRTLRFDASAPGIDRLPMATEYRVTVPAGMLSTSGSATEAASSFTFRTPAVTVQSVQPLGESLGLEPVFVATFDQRVDADAVLSSLALRADDREVEVRAATAEEVEADDNARLTAAATPDGRWLAFRAIDPLPTDAALEISFEPGTPSAEGPLTTDVAQSFSARTYAPLTLDEVTCDGRPACWPSSSVTLVFDNPLDASAFTPDMVDVEPEITGYSAAASGSVVQITGGFRPRTTYTVTVVGELTDVYGQRLGEAEHRDVTFGEAMPQIVPFDQPLTTLDPSAASPQLAIRTVNRDDVRVRVFDVSPDGWTDFTRFAMDLSSGGTTAVPAPSWEQRSDTTLATPDSDDATETMLDLSDALTGDGHLVVLVEPTETLSPDSEEYWSNRPTVTWVQRTSIGLDAFGDSSKVVAWATDLATGTPTAGIDVGLLGVSVAVATDADGLATIELPGTGSAALLARSGDDSAILPAGYYGELFEASPSDDELRWYVVDDRGIYRPGESVSLKALVRRVDANDDRALVLPTSGATVTYTVHDPQYQELGTGTTELDANGGFDVTFDLPPGANLGYASVDLSIAGLEGISFTAYTHSFRIEQFRRPEFEVAARAESDGPYVSSRPATVAVDATYYAGGPLGAAPVRWTVTTAPASYSPPGWDEFSFGEWIPFWETWTSYDTYRGGDICCDFPTTDAQVEEWTGTTDAAGSHFLKIDFAPDDSPRPDLPVTVTAEAAVTDVNRQEWASETNLLVHPASLYVGLRGARTFVREGEPLDIDAVVTDIDGASVPGHAITVTAARIEQRMVDGVWTDVALDPQTCDVTSAVEPLPCSFATPIGGTYRISSTVTDDDAGASRTELTRWVSGAAALPDREVTLESVILVPDEESYSTGDTAEVLVQAPFSGSALVTVARGDIRTTEVITLTDGSAVFTLPITDDDIPGLDLTVEAVGSTTRTADDGTALPDAPTRPAFAIGSVHLSVSLASRTLTVDAVPTAETVEPGTSTSVEITVTDADGAAVRDAHLAVVVADEAVLAVGGYQLPDPLAAFFPSFGSYVRTWFARSTVRLGNPTTLLPTTGGGDDVAASDTTAAADGGVAAESAAPTAFDSDDSVLARSAGGSSAGGGTIAERSDFSALALFEPDVVTGADGTVRIDVPLPDNLTRYRVMVVASEGADRFGFDDANITARLPLMVRPSAPRFANFGDSFELPVVLQNQTDTAMSVDVVLETANLISIAPAGRRVEVPANDRVETRFPLQTVSAGDATIRVSAVSGEAADSATVVVPVYTPATAEAFATYGVLDEGITSQPILAPTDVVPEFGGLEVTTSSTALQSLTDAVLYLVDYPYASSDAFASRITAIASLRDVLEAFEAPGLPSASEIDSAITADITALTAMQNDDGGFPSWQRTRRSEPYNTIQATHALITAQAAGYAVPAQAIEMARSYLASIESYIQPETSREVRDALVAYALYVRHLAGDDDTAAALALWNERGEDLPLDAIGWLWPVIDDPSALTAILRAVGNRAVDTAGSVTFTSSYDDDANVILASDQRTDAVILSALLEQAPDSDLVPKIVTGLLAGRTRGRWHDVQANSFALLALRQYFDRFEASDPDFSARTWLGERYAGEQQYRGRSTDRIELTVPTADLIAAGDTDVVIEKNGTGRLYYRIGMRYAPADLDLTALDRGFEVGRTFEAVDDPGDVVRRPDGSWTIRAGTRVRVRVTMVAESQRAHAALVDPLAAGLEIVNPDLATSPDVPTDQPSFDPSAESTDSNVTGERWWTPTWFDHQNQRDDRAEVFASLLPAGVYDYSYVARATTPGQFVVPPARAEEIYAPETFGRSATDRIVIS